MTTKAEKAHGSALDKLARLSTRQDELLIASEASKADLASFRTEAAQSLIDGKDSEKVAGALATRESKAAMFAGALAEVETQITAQQAIVAEAEKIVSAEAAAEAARQIRTSSLKMIEKMAALQVDLYKCLQQQQRHMQRSPILDFNTAADRLALVQEILEKDETIVSQSKVPRARRIGGFIDDTHTVTSLGSAVRDWARQEVTG